MERSSTSGAGTRRPLTRSLTKRRRTEAPTEKESLPPTPPPPPLPWNVQDLLPGELRNLISEHTSYPDHREHRSVDITDVNFPSVAYAMVRDDAARWSNVRTLTIRTNGLRLTPENERALGALLIGLGSMKSLIFDTMPLTPPIWRTFLPVIERLNSLDISKAYWVHCDAMEPIIAGRLRQARGMRHLNVGALHSTNHPLNGIADAVASMDWLQRLTLEILPDGLWSRRNGRQPKARWIHLCVNENCSRADIDWDWFCSERTAEDLTVEGNLDAEMIPRTLNGIQMQRRLCLRLGSVSDPRRSYNDLFVRLLVLSQAFAIVYIQFEPTVHPAVYHSNDWMTQFSRIKECMQLQLSHHNGRIITFEILLSGVSGVATHPNGYVTTVTAAWLLTFCINDAVLYNGNDRPPARFVIYVPADGVQPLTAALRAVRFRPNLTWENILDRNIVRIEDLS
jgi:hypothetical protein